MELEGSYCGDEIDFGVMCFCGERAPLRKSKSNANPGRRFFGCSNYMVRMKKIAVFFAGITPRRILKKKEVLRPMKIWNVREVGKASEQAESSSTPLKKIDEIHCERNAMQVKIDAMEVEIEKLKVANRGTSKWKVWIYGFVGLFMYYLYNWKSSGNQLALP